MRGLGLGLGIALSGVGFRISPGVVTVAPRAGQTFTASGGVAPYTYSLHTNNSGGSIGSSSGAYTAGTTASVTDVVRATDNLGATVDATVTVSAGVSISPATFTIAATATKTFTASGGSGTGFTYTSTGVYGSVNSSTGVYTGDGFGGGSDTITATDSLGNTGTATVTVSVLFATLARYRADLGVTASSNLVTAWNDQSGTDSNKNTTAAGGARPTLNASDSNFNSKKSISFGAANALTSGTWTSAFSGTFTALIVGRSHNTGTSNHYFFDGNGGNRVSFFDDEDNNTLYSYTDGFSIGLPYTSGTPASLVWVIGTNNIKQSINSNTLTNTTPGTAAAGTLPSIVIGNFSQAIVLGDVDIAELILLDHEISSTDLAHVNSYFASRYGLTIT